MKKELIGVLICMLLISVAFAPVVNALDVETKEVNDVINEASDQSRTFTDEKLEALEQLMDEINYRLDNAKSWSETKAVLKWTVIELDKFDLLPAGMSIEKAQQLMISMYRPTQLSTLMNNLRSMHRGCNPVVTEDAPVEVSKNIPTIKKSTSENTGSLLDNLYIRCQGSYLILDAISILQGYRTPIIETLITNFNDVDITLERHVTVISKPGNRIIFDLDDNPPYKLNPDQGCVTKYFMSFFLDLSLISFV